MSRSDALGARDTRPSRGSRSRRASRPAAAGADAPGVAVRVAAVQVLEQLLGGGGSLTRLLPAAQAALPEGERALLQAYAFGLARWSVQLEALLAGLLERPLKRKDRDLHLLLQLGLFQLLHTRTPEHVAVDATVAATRALDKPWARGLVNAVLRNALRRREALLAGLDEDARLAHPDWLLDALRADWPERWREIAAANNAQAPMTLRVNLAATTRAAYRERLAEAELAATVHAAAPGALVLERAVPVGALPGFARGLVSVQDAAAQLAVGYLVDAVPAGARLLDACAAPGGKTAQALESGHFGDVVALDRDPARLERVGETLARLGLDGAREGERGADRGDGKWGEGGERDGGPDDDRGGRVTLRVADAADTDAWWDGTAFGAVLLDAPCTGTGVIRRHPDIKLLRRAGDVAALAAEQSRLLDALWATLAPGGSLLYATCSMLRAEGEEQVQAFLARRPDAALAHERRVTVGEDGMDGFYHARLERRG